MNKKIQHVFMLLFVFIFMTTGYTFQVEANPKQLFETATVKSLDIKSYESQTSLTINDLQFSNYQQLKPALQKIISMFKHAKFNFHVIHQQNPLQTEITLDVELSDDAKTKFSIPIICTEDKFWIKLPSVPLFPLPPQLSDKFIELDLKQIMQLSGKSFLSDDDSKQFYRQFVTAFQGKFDEKTYFSFVEPKKAKLPPATTVKHVVKFNLTNENLESFFTTSIKKILPEIIDLLTKEKKYKEHFNISAHKMYTMRKFQQHESEWKVALQNLKKIINIHELSSITAINKDDYPTFSTLTMNLDIYGHTPDKVKIMAQITEQLSKINEKAQFKIGIPTNTITLKQFQQNLGHLF